MAAEMPGETPITRSGRRSLRITIHEPLESVRQMILRRHDQIEVHRRRLHRVSGAAR